MINAPRGTHDILPDEQPLFRHVTGTFAELAERYGYRPISTPTIEHVELIERTSGEGSDIIQKEIYTLVDRSGRTLALRPEATAPVARAYLEHGMHREPQPVKTYLVGQMFRYDRPQRGRYREFWQLNAGGDGLGRSRPGRRGDPAVRPALAHARHPPLLDRAELDRRPRMPPRVHRRC